MRKVFLDCGAHAGTSVKKFREEYPNSNEYEIISFECNPRFTETLNNTDGITFHNKEDWIEDGTQDFYIGHAASSSLIYGKTRGNLDFDNPVTVESVDLSKWLTENFNKDDHIILKMDIEGAEYQVLPKMISDGSIDYVDVVYVEFHGMKVFKTRDDTKKIRTAIRNRGIPVHHWDAQSNKKILGI